MLAATRQRRACRVLLSAYEEIVVSSREGLVPRFGGFHARQRSYDASNAASAQELIRRMKNNCIQNLTAFVCENSSVEDNRRRMPQEMVVDAVRMARSAPELHDSLGDLAEACVDFLHIGTFSTSQLLFLVDQAKLPSPVIASMLEELQRRSLLADELVDAFGSCVANRHTTIALGFWESICAKHHELNAAGKIQLRNWFQHPNSNMIREECVQVAKTHAASTANIRAAVEKRFRIKFRDGDVLSVSN